ncbi:hypothetical protein ACLK1Z_12320 [Escherichia coli]
MSEPLIVGIRHHSPACARLAKSLIESQRPRYVLIEGPADFNDRVDELFLAHQLPGRYLQLLPVSGRCGPRAWCLDAIC